MPKRIPGLDWLDAKNQEQKAWALDYLYKKGITIRRDFEDHATLLIEGSRMERSAIGRETLNLMKAAWRTQKSRSPTNGKKATTFTLKLTTKKTLAKLAKSRDVSATSLIETLIENAALENKERSRMHRPSPNNSQRALKGLTQNRSESASHLDPNLNAADPSGQKQLSPAQARLKKHLSTALALLPTSSGGTRQKNRQKPSKVTMTESVNAYALDPNEVIELTGEPETFTPLSVQEYERLVKATQEWLGQKRSLVASSALVESAEKISSLLGPEPEGVIEFE